MCEGKDRLVSNHPPPLGSSCLNTALPVAVCSLEMFWKVTQNRMAILPSVLELDLGQGALGGWSLVGSEDRSNGGGAPWNRSEVCNDLWE